MSQELKLVISDGKKIIETVAKKTFDTQPALMVKSLIEFRLLVNAALTKLIEDSDDTSNCLEDDEDSDSEEEDIEVSPKKRKK